MCLIHLMLFLVIGEDANWDLNINDFICLFMLRKLEDMHFV